MGCPFDVAAQEPTLDTVLARSAAYVDRLFEQLSSIVAEELYVQEVKPRAGGSRAVTADILRKRRLRSDLLLIRPEGASRHIEFRDVFEVDGRSVRDREDRLSRLFLERRPDGKDPGWDIVEESARYNIGNIPRNVNTPMLPLLFLRASEQPRFTFARGRAGNPDLNTIAVGAARNDAIFRVSAEMWVVEFKERRERRGTVIRTNEGRDFPAAGRFWIEPETGVILMSELAMDGYDVKAVIDVSYQSDPLLGFHVPVEMRERYNSRGDRIEGIASYGRFRKFQVNTGEDIALPPVTPTDNLPVKPPPKPPGRR